jgi:hypothetical protein
MSFSAATEAEPARVFKTGVQIAHTDGNGSAFLT